MNQYLFIVFLIFAYEPVHADFYVDDGETVRSIRGDQNQYQALEWQIRLYKRSESAWGDRSWGLITGNSAASVMNKLKDSQGLEKKWEKWTGLSWGELTNFNPLGPIAVLNRKNRQNNVLNKIQGIREQLSTIWEAHKNLTKILYSKSDGNPFKASGGALKEYAENFKHVFQMQEELRKIEESTSNSENYLTRQLNELSSDIEKSHNEIGSYLSEYSQDEQQQTNVCDNKNEGFIGRVDGQSGVVECRCSKSNNRCTWWPVLTVSPVYN